MGNFVEWATADNGDDEDWTEHGRHDDDSDGDFPFSNIDLSHSNKYDCVVVFDDGHRSTEWSYKLYDTLTFNYLDLLDADDIEQRKNRFPHQGADWSTSSSSSMLSVHDFNKNERKLVIKALKKIDIDCKSIHSLNRRISSQFHHNNTATTTTTNSDGPRYRFYYVGIREDKCRRWAHQIGHQLQLEPENAVLYLTLHDENLAKATAGDDDDNHTAVNSALWRHMYVQYDQHVAPQIYKEFYGTYGYDTADAAAAEVGDADDIDYSYEPSLFTIRDRITLINDAVTRDVDSGGAGMYIPRLQAASSGRHCIVDFFPLHTLEHLRIILSKLFNLKYFCRPRVMFNLPLKEIRFYFGEYFAIYFAFLQFLTWYFVPLVVVGIVFGVLQIVQREILMSYVWVFALFVVAWSVLLPIFWRRMEYRYSKKWGTLRFVSDASSSESAVSNGGNEERTRPQFAGEHRTSNVDGSEETYFDRSRQNVIRCAACSVVFSFFIALMASIAGIICLRLYVLRSSAMYGSYMIAATNTVIILFFNNVYSLVAERLNEWENWKTETQFEDNLIVKIFVFRFINSYASLYYIAFIRVYETDEALACTPEECMADLRIQLSFIFLSQLVVNNVLELLPLLLRRCLCAAAVARSKNVSSTGLSFRSFFVHTEADFVYNQYVSNVYGRTFDDYCEILIAFGYSTLFVICFPFAPFFAFIGFIVEARIDGYKLCKLSRRPFPRQCQTIGTWQLALEVLSWAILVTNLFIVCFTTEMLNVVPHSYLSGDVYFQEVVTSLILVSFLISAVIVLNKCIGRRPQNIADHIRRQTHIEQELKQIGDTIERYIDSIVSSNESDAFDWKQWDVDKVAIFLQKVLYKNRHRFHVLKRMLKQANFDGHAFAKCDEVYLDQHLHFDTFDDEDSVVKKFILHAREQLIKHQRLTQHQDSLVASVSLVEGVDDDGDECDADHEDEVDSDESDDSEDEQEDECTRDDGAFATNGTSSSSYDSYQQAVSYSVSLSQQSPPSKSSAKTKTKTTPVRSALSSTFHFTHQNLYGMAVFYETELKAQSRLKLWHRIDKDMVDVIQTHEMDAFLYLTIVVYIKGKYPHARVPKFNDSCFRQQMVTPLKDWLLHMKISPPGLTLQQYNTFFAAWIREYHCHRKQSRSSGRSSYSGYQSSYLSRHQLVPIREASDCEQENDENNENSEMKAWNSTCKDWLNRMQPLSQFIDSTLESTRTRVWQKFDATQRNRLETEKYLPKLLYSFIVLSIKSQSTKLHAPRYKELYDVLKFMSKHLIEKVLPAEQKTYMSKRYFVKFISADFRRMTCTHTYPL